MYEIVYCIPTHYLILFSKALLCSTPKKVWVRIRERNEGEGKRVRKV